MYRMSFHSLIYKQKQLLQCYILRDRAKFYYSDLKVLFCLFAEIDNVRQSE